MRSIAALVLVFWLSQPGFAVKPKKHRPSQSTQTAAASAKKPAKKGTRTGRQSAAARRAAARRRALAQTAPTPERYQQIQQALLAKGYGPQTPTGVWSPDWASALKRYQQDQKLEPTGKLNSLSLITLGLGPKREANGVTAPPLPHAPQPSSSSSAVRELK